MAEEKILEEEILDDEQLDKVAGGTAKQSEDAIKAFRRMSVTDGNGGANVAKIVEEIYYD